ncbi:MAG: helix-turn-helix domain-containing protein [Chloroflexi bacterium]|nr:helix-turn-helix domain-containing protein [Chloroflexota bacterium]
MENYCNLNQFEPVKLLSDPRRLAILQLLMQQPATLTQIGHALGSYPAKVRHHVKKLTSAGLIDLVETRIVGGTVEKYYQATAKAYLVNLTIVPASESPTVLLFGSHDLAVEQLASELHQDEKTPNLMAVPVGSLDGLIALKQGVCQLAGAHLLDAGGDEFNLSYVQHLFPGQETTLMTLVHRQQGLIVQAGNPKQIQGIADLGRDDVRFINRQPGAGTRVWSERMLQQFGILKDDVVGWETIARTHREVADAVAVGTVDFGVGILAAAQTAGLDFIPLFDERYDLIMPASMEGESIMKPLLDRVQTAVFRQSVEQLAGYDAQHMGEVRQVG